MSKEKGIEKETKNNSYQDKDSNNNYNINTSSSVIENRKAGIPNKNRKSLKKALDKFLSEGWKIPQKKRNNIIIDNFDNDSYQLSDDDEIAEGIHKLIHDKLNKNKSIVVCNNEVILNDLLLECDIHNKNNYVKSVGPLNKLENIVRNIEKFEKINNQLSSKYSVKIFPNIESANKLPDLKILIENASYIDHEDSKSLNEFIKLYWEYYEFFNYSNIDFNLAKIDVVSEVSNLTNELNLLKNYSNRLKKIFNDVDIDYLNDFDIAILKKDPSLINTENKMNFLSLLEKYQRNNPNNINVVSYFNTFSSNSFILEIISNFKKFKDDQLNYKKANMDIGDLKTQFNSAGLNITNLNDYSKVKDKISKYEDISYVDNEDYIMLDDKLHEFLTKNCSFNEFLEKCKQDIISNLDSNLLYSEVNNAIKNILSDLEEMGITINTLKEFDDHENDFNILKEYVNLDLNDSENNEISIEEYCKKLFDELKDISKSILKFSDVFEASDLDLIIYHVNILNNLIDKIGLNINSLKHLNESFLIIANIERDTSAEIFTSKSTAFLENERYVIHNDLDTLKNSMEYLLSQFGEDSDLINTPINNLAKKLKDQYKLNIIISDITSYFDSTSSFEEILDNYNIIIQLNLNLVNNFNLNEFKSKLNQMLNEFNSIEEIHKNNRTTISIENKHILDNISDYQHSVYDKFNNLMRSTIFDGNKIANCDLKNNLNDLNNNINTVRDFIIYNGYYNVDFKEINKHTEEIISENDKIELKIEKSNLYDFYDICKQLNKSNYGYDTVKDILELTFKLNIPEYDKFQQFSLKDLTIFSNNLSDCIEFSYYVDEGILNKDFQYCPNEIIEINSKIDSINKYLTDSNLDTSILDNLSSAPIYDINLLEETLLKIDEIMKTDYNDMDRAIENYKNLIDMLLNLCNTYYIEFEIGDDKLNSLDLKLKLSKIKKDLEINSLSYELENEILSYNEFINKNLSNIWNGPITDIETIKNKFEIDEEFTNLFNKGIFSDKTLNHKDELSKNDMIFVNDLKTNRDESFKSNCNLFYKNYEYLMQYVDKLNETNENDLESYLKIFENINEIFKSTKIADCIILLKFNIANEDSINLLNEHLKKLESYSDIYYKYFRYNEFDIPIEEMINKLNLHFKYTELIDSKIINKNQADEIKNNANNILDLITELEDLKTKISSEIEENHIGFDVDFKEIKANWYNMKNAKIVLSNLESLRTCFNNDYEDYFDNAYYYVDDEEFTVEDLIQLYLISKNEITNLQLMEE